jgi:hypothetical protein
VSPWPTHRPLLLFLTLPLSLCRSLASGKVTAIPHPDANWDVFIQSVGASATALGVVWDPIKQVDHPWIRVEKLVKTYRPDLAPRCVLS